MGGAGRWLAVDHGARRIGLAVGDEATAIASPVEQVRARDADCLDRIARLARAYDVRGIVVGWPLLADGSEGPQGRTARRFAVALADATGMDVRIWDERLSSFAADQRLKGTLTRKRKKRRHDAVAAAAFLEDFLHADGPRNAPRPDADTPP
ncbi:MAG: Holliday junction resolvase RuvX [Planctomycetota bacterium]|jgi:putative Holliday junction resolvase